MCDPGAMSSTRRLAVAAVVVCALGAAPAVAATSSPAPRPTSSSASPSGSASSTSSATPSPTATASSTPAAPTKTATPRLTVDRPFTLELDAQGTIEPSGLPDERTLFTKKELAQAVPGLTGARATDDTLTLTVKGSAENESTSLVINLKQFGKKADVTKSWAEQKKAHQARSTKNPGLYTFFGAHAYGAEDSFSDGTTTHVLLVTGDAAADIWFSGIGFSSLGDNHQAARKAYRDKVVPQLVQLLADKAATGAPKPSPSPRRRVPPRRMRRRHRARPRRRASPLPDGRASGLLSPRQRTWSASCSSSS